MDDETFITHLLNSLPQSEYEGAIFVIKDKLRKGPVDLPEIEQVLEDKYQAMKHAKGWEEEEDDYALFTSPLNKKKAQESIQRMLWILWGIWTQSSQLSQQEKQSKYGSESGNTAKEKAEW